MRPMVTRMKLEDFIVRNITIFSCVGLALRFVLYGLPSLGLVWLYVLLSFLVGVGGAALAVGREYQRQRYGMVGILLVILGLLPFQYLVLAISG